MNKSTLLLSCAVAMIATSCSSEGKGNGAGAASAESTKIESEAFETSLNIRYVSMDSISKNYILAQNIAAKANTLVTELQTYQMQLQNQLQNQANQIQQKAQNNLYLSQASYDADMKELQKKNDSFQRQYAQREQNAAVTMDNLQKELRDSIENYINVYNKEKKYDAILYKDAGLYFNPALDITQEILDGLNARYTGEAIGSATTTAPATLNNPASLNTPAGTGLKNPATLPTTGNK